ncbi:helix-turn-helix domain-containing protein [Niallia sp. 03133]|uniref:helix-turn-helix domain-containing protein n=1 Tax=Niallia sp. 03133 TaxID=3458060 RepID=UPI004043A871
MLQKLNELRKQKNWSLQETADLLGIAKSTYAGYESGYREPSLRALIQIADLYDVSVDYILKRKKTSTTIELTDYHDGYPIITVDNKPLTTLEIKNIIAFTKIRRNLD